MKLLLSTRDRRRLEIALGALVAPLDHVDLDDWRRSVNTSIKPLLGADFGSFLFPVAGSPSLLSDDLAPTTAQLYPYNAPRFGPGFSMWKRMERQVVYDRRSIYGKHLDEYFRGEYYNEYCIPARAHDSMGVTVLVGDGTFDNVLTPASQSALLFHHDSPDVPPFGERGLQLLRLLVPALRAGVRMRFHFGDQRDRLNGLLDAFGAGVLLCTLDGRALHQTPQLTRMLQEDPDAASVRDRMLEQARQVGRLEVAIGFQGFPAASEITTRTQPYRAHAVRLDASVLAYPVVMVTLESRRPAVLSDVQLREHYGLSPQGIRIARLLGEGRSNPAIAAELSISPAAARHQAEIVMMKLGVTERDQVRGRLMAIPLARG